MPHTLTETNRSAFLAKLNRAFWLGAGALLAVGLTFALLAWLNQRSVSLVLESQTTGRLAREARALALDREASIRGYLLTKKEISLAPEFHARGPLNAKLDSLVRLSSDNASQRDRALAVRTAVRRWERGWAMPVLDPTTGIANATVRDSLAGKELFDSIRGALESFLSGQQRIFNMRVRALGFLQRFSFFAIVIEGMLLLGVLVWLRRRSFIQTNLMLEQQSLLQAQSLDLQQQAAELEEQAVELEEQADEANQNVNALADINQSLEQTIKRLEAAESVASTAKSHGDVIEGLFNVLMENAPVGVVLYDSAKRIVRVNPALGAMTGLNGDHSGKTVYELSNDELAETVDGILDDVLANEKPVMNVPLAGTNKVDLLRERHFLCSYFPVMLPGREKGVGGVVVETTQFRQLEEQLLQSQKMEAVGRLAGGVAHDFNNMLTAIMSYSDLILGDLPQDSALRPDMVEIVKAAEKATALTRKLLAFSRQQVLRPAMVDLNATIEGLRKMIKRLLGSSVNLSMDFGEGLWTVSADPTEVERVIMNLVLNARDAMADGGKLIVETSNVTIDEEYARGHADVEAGDYVMVAITDTGAGMTREVREKLFEPFFTTKEKGKGTGLGLPSVYGIVKQSGGFLWVYSEIGKGTTFKVYLPRTTETRAPGATTPQRNRVIGAETILLVEDDEEVRQVASRILRRNGYRVLEAGNGADALRVCEGEAEPVDLIVTDIVMPEMGGSELAKKIREQRPDARILFTSGYTEDAVVRQSLLHEGEAFIEKPFTPAKLAKKAREMLSTEDDLS